MSLESQLTDAFLDAYRLTGQQTGYWARRFVQAVKQTGGLATAKRMLLPRNAGQRKGLDTLLEAGRPELTIEAIVLQSQFQSLFSKTELATARERLSEFQKEVAVVASSRERLFPDELDPGTTYVEGAKKQVRVNAFERNKKARMVCVAHYGYSCSVCGFDFESRYGDIGKEFIHVHHLKALALTDGQYELDPIADLRPICPNCHAMLHRGEVWLSIEALRERLKLARK